MIVVVKFISSERSLYVFELVIMLKKELGFLFVEEYCWTKNAFPGSLKGRFKNAFEPVYHFTKENPNQITFNPIACGTPMKEESIARTYRKQCGAPKNGSGMTGMNTTNIRNLEFARPSNVVNVNNVSNQFTLKSDHSATFPEKLVEFFVKSGTTGLVCIDTNRKYLLIDKEQSNIDLILKRVGEKRKEKDLTQKTLFGDGM